MNIHKLLIFSMVMIGAPLISLDTLHYLEFSEGQLEDKTMTIAKRWNKFTREYAADVFVVLALVCIPLMFISLILMLVLNWPVLSILGVFGWLVLAVLFGLIAYKLIPCGEYLTEKYFQAEVKECEEKTCQAKLQKQEYEAEKDKKLQEQAERIIMQHDTKALYELLKDLKGEITKNASC